VAYLAAHGAAAFGARIGVPIVLALSLYNAHLAGTEVAAYSRRKAPAFRLLDDMQSAARDLPGPPVFAADRRESLDLRRPIEWVGDAMPPLAARLPAPPQHEWLELVKYWNGGGRNPVWLVTDPRRAQAELIQHGDPAPYRWGLQSPVLMGGVRPDQMDWYRLDRPEWYVGEGWALTPESAGIAETDHRGLATGPIDGWIHRTVISDGMMVIGGRNFSGSETRLNVALDAHAIGELPIMPGAFLQVFKLASASAPVPTAEYGRLSITASPPPRVAIEQFDASSRRPMIGFGAGWQEQEFNPTTGLRWRWLSERGELRVVSRGGPLALRIDGESPRKYFSRPSRLLVRAGNRVLIDDRLSSDFSETVTIPADVVPGDGIITFETDQVFLPADRSRRSFDRRHLGLRIFRCEIRPAG
jgi:hypothetical protein